MEREGGREGACGGERERVGEGGERGEGERGERVFVFCCVCGFCFLCLWWVFVGREEGCGKEDR